MLKFDALKYPPPPSEIAAYQVTDPTICRSECRISDLWVFGYLNLLSNLLCGGGATMLYFFRPLLLDYASFASTGAIVLLSSFISSTLLFPLLSLLPNSFPGS